MPQKLVKIILKLLIVLGTPVFLFSSIALNFFPEHFTIGIYGLLDTQRNYLQNDHTSNRVLIIGDSIAQSAYLPEILSDDTYNLGIGNETPVDGYYRLTEYLENHPKPDYILCSYNPIELVKQDAFWTTTMYERGITFEQAKAIVQDARHFNADSGIIRDHMLLQAWAYQYGFHIDSAKMVLKGIAKNATDETCYENYRNQCEWVTAHKGHWKHYMSGGSGTDINGNVANPFAVTEMGDCYMRKIIDLCQENDITIIMETVPINHSSFAAMIPEYRNGYESYCRTLAQDYPDLIINGQIAYYDDACFCDSLHFNADGTEKFSYAIREKYSYIFEEDEN